jgi:hypothetical protein
MKMLDNVKKWKAFQLRSEIKHPVSSLLFNIVLKDLVSSKTKQNKAKNKKKPKNNNNKKNQTELEEYLKSKEPA